jgi:tetratricopeptide (TPR) repeat protein
MIRLFPMRAAAAALVLALGTAGALAADTVRPEVGNPLKAAQAAVKQGKGKEALAEVAKADAASNKTPYESFLIQQMRGSAALAAGENETAIKSFEAVLASGRVSGREALQMQQAVAVGYYKLKDYPKAAAATQKYFKDGGNEASMRTVLLQSYYLGNDCNAVGRMLGEDSSHKASEEELQILRTCYSREKDDAGYVAATERLLQSYPKKEYWTELLARVQRKPGFSDRLGVHVYKLRSATGNFASANDYMELAQLALQDGVPAEAQVIVGKGYAAGVLGKGSEAARQKRLADLVDKTLAESKKTRAQDEKDAQAAKTGDDLVRIGLEYVYEGQADKGLALIEQGIKRGGLKRPEDAKLRLGEAQLYAGKKNAAVATLKTVKGSDGTADIARLWVLQART